MERDIRVWRQVGRVEKVGRDAMRELFFAPKALLVGLIAAATFLGCAMWQPKPKAAATLKCPAEQIQIEENTAYSVVARGCGKADVIVMEGSGKASSLRDRAVFELSCADTDVDVNILSTSLYGVTGCGRKIMYKYVPRVGIVADTAQETGAPSTTGAPSSK